eukprot:TRINITY_DN4732_c0_g1_i4.p1 TRINITY_DN4732_c0_g1~~TRINITY_DN4732_c0_g1_i4.p1  ORF type:complete len:118 (-),score=7.69 TRINITY_DN4732_c0_g1_i4:614-967(-)
MGEREYDLQELQQTKVLCGLPEDFADMISAFVQAPFEWDRPPFCDVVTWEHQSGPPPWGQKKEISLDSDIALHCDPVVHIALSRGCGMLYPLFLRFYHCIEPGRRVYVCFQSLVADK